jgi:molybdopterin-guanine dinucleotide biosynthesis protein A
VSALFDDCRWRQLDESDLLADADLARLDPGLESVTNLNDQYDYQAARDRLPPAIQVQWLSGGPGSRLPAQSGTPADAGGAARVTIRAATLGAAAEAFDVVLGSNIVAALNGEPVRQDPEEPLVEGDVVVFATEAGG